MVPNGQFSQRFEENTANFSGSKARGNTAPAPSTQARQQAMQSIYDMATDKGVPVDTIVTGIMKNSLAEIRGYIQSKGETPLDDTTACCLQAVMLRANDVATVSRTLDISDEDALESIEGAESELTETGNPEKDNIPTIPVQAAMACAMDFLSNGHAAATVAGVPGDGRMGTVLSQAKQAGKAWSKVMQTPASSSFLGDGTGDASDPSTQDPPDPFAGINYADPSTWGAIDQSGSTDLPATTISSTLATIPVGGLTTPSGGPSVAAGIPTISTAGAVLPTAGPSTSAGGVLNSITALLSGITSVASGITTAANSSAGAVGAIKNAVSNVGANSIATYIQNNKGTIILVVILLAFLIYVAVYAAKHNRQ